MNDMSQDPGRDDAAGNSIKPSVPVRVHTPDRTFRRSEAAYFYGPAGHRPIRTFLMQEPPAHPEHRGKEGAEVIVDVHHGPLEPRELMAKEATTAYFDGHETAEGSSRVDRAYWEDEVLVGALLNWTRRPEWFGGECLAIVFEADKDGFRIVRVMPKD